MKTLPILSRHTSADFRRLVPRRSLLSVDFLRQDNWLCCICHVENNIFTSRMVLFRVLVALTAVPRMSVVMRPALLSLATPDFVDLPPNAGLCCCPFTAEMSHLGLAVSSRVKVVAIQPMTHPGGRSVGIYCKGTCHVCRDRKAITLV